SRRITFAALRVILHFIFVSTPRLSNWFPQEISHFNLTCSIFHYSLSGHAWRIISSREARQLPDDGMNLKFFIQPFAGNLAKHIGITAAKKLVDRLAFRRRQFPFMIQQRADLTRRLLRRADELYIRTEISCDDVRHERIMRAA